MLGQLWAVACTLMHNKEQHIKHRSVAAEIARASYDIDNYKQIMGVIARRLQDSEEDWRHVYKSLLLLEFMSKHGPSKVQAALGH